MIWFAFSKSLLSFCVEKRRKGKGRSRETTEEAAAISEGEWFGPGGCGGGKTKYRFWKYFRVRSPQDLLNVHRL